MLWWLKAKLLDGHQSVSWFDRSKSTLHLLRFLPSKFLLFHDHRNDCRRRVTKIVVMLKDGSNRIPPPIFTIDALVNILYILPLWFQHRQTTTALDVGFTIHARKLAIPATNDSPTIALIHPWIGNKLWSDDVMEYVIAHSSQTVVC